MKFLLTGFEPFGGSDVNPSELVARTLASENHEEIRLHTAILPVDRYQAPELIYKFMQEIEPDAIICLGEAARRPAITLEQVAINLMDYRIADNSGNMIEDMPVFETGPAAYFSTLPIRMLRKEIEEAKIPVEISLSAGAYLCNQIMYSVLHKLACEGNNIPAGFIHLPMLPEQACKLNPLGASMALEMMVAAVRITLTPQYYNRSRLDQKNTS